MAPTWTETDCPILSNTRWGCEPLPGYEQQHFFLHFSLAFLLFYASVFALFP
jgi:hypothetical protein